MHPHQLPGLYQTGSTCSNKLGQGYGSSYDAWGNVTSRSYNGTSATLSYDSLDHLVKWDAGSSSQEQYVYDAAGHRVLRRSTVAGSTTMTVYAFGTEEHLYSGTGVNQSNTYYYTLAGHLVGESTGSNTNAFLTDALGSVITTISATAGSAAVQGNQAYGPYGNTRYQVGSMGTAKGFTGQYQDATGLDYYGARYYDPVVGRFISADTVQGNGQGMEPYAYVGGNPETNNDPTGQKVVSCAQASHSRCEGPEGSWGGVGGGGGWDGDSGSGAPSGSPGSDQLTPEEQLLEQETAQLDQELHLDPNAEPDLQAMELRGEQLQEAERAQEEQTLAAERAQEAAADQQAAPPPAPTDQGESTPPPAPPPTGTEKTTPAAPERTAPPEQPPTQTGNNTEGTSQVGSDNSNTSAQRSGNIPDNLQPTLDRINRGERFPHRNDGSVFQNREGLLPPQPFGYYREYVVPTPGITGPGAQRIIIGQGGEIYYTPDHYRTFFPVP
jgi:RHS repeat-associated protein